MTRFKFRPSLESLDGRVLPDATPVGPPPDPNNPPQNGSEPQDPPFHAPLALTPQQVADLTTARTEAGAAHGYSGDIDWDRLGDLGQQFDELQGRIDQAKQDYAKALQDLVKARTEIDDLSKQLDAARLNGDFAEFQEIRGSWTALAAVGTNWNVRS